MKKLVTLILILVATACRLAAADSSNQPFPVRGFCIGAPSATQVDRFVKFINEELAPRAVNTLIVRVDYNYQFTSHPEVRERGALSKADVKKIVEACKQDHIRLIPLIDLLGHQSWANHMGALLRAHPEFDETPWVKMPERYSWPNPDRLYCKSYCPLHPGMHEVIFALIDELCDAFETDAFHAGMDEVFYIGEDKCPRCSGKDRAALFAGEVTAIHDHLAQNGRKLWIWGDRLLDGKTTGLGEWEASVVGTAGAIDLIPKDVVICDWHYDRAEPTAAYFALKGFGVVTCPWRKENCAVEQVRDLVRLRAQSNPVVRKRVLGLVQTVWSGANSFMDNLYGASGTTARRGNSAGEVKCFVRAFDEIKTLANTPGAGGAAEQAQ
jgi:Glycosyl hydrolase family 20, catalytic domain